MDGWVAKRYLFHYLLLMRWVDASPVFIVKEDHEYKQYYLSPNDVNSPDIVNEGVSFPHNI